MAGAPIDRGCDERQWRRMLSRRRALHAGAATAAVPTMPLGRPGALAPEAMPGRTPTTQGRVLVDGSEPIVNDSYVGPLVEICGEVEIGRRCFIANNAILHAAEGRLVSLGDENNCQDNTHLLAQRQNLRFGNMVSIAHQAVVENSVVGDFAFFGFRSRTRNCEVGAGSMIMHNTIVENVVVPPNRITPFGVRIATQEEADALPELADANEAFKLEVQDVNLALVAGYTALDERLGRSGLDAVGPSPSTPFNPDPVEPRIGAGTVLGELVRIVGDVRLGEGSSVGQRTAIRADEGTPIVIGRRARIQRRVTFHALLGTSIDIGDDARIGDGNVIHGPLRIGDNFVSEADCVVFRATIEDDVAVRAGATVAGDVVLREGTIVPAGAVVTTQDEADRLPVRKR